MLELKLFETDQENDKLNKSVLDLTKQLQQQHDDNCEHIAEMNIVVETHAEKLNNAEQYSRNNNIRINVIKDNGEDNADITTETVISILNQKIEGLNLSNTDIDISHRLGEMTGRVARPVIVKFTSRLKREVIMRNRRQFKGSNIYINEDLTQLNRHVLICTKRKMPDAIEGVWTCDGKLFYKNKMGYKLHTRNTTTG